jgi:RNA polymerase sigma-70 factor (ECF subfamily)
VLPRWHVACPYRPRRCRVVREARDVEVWERAVDDPEGGRARASFPAAEGRDRGGLHGLHEAYAAGRQAWTGLRLSYPQFCAYLLRSGNGAVLPARPAELYLCASCALGQENAYRALEKTYFPPLKLAIQPLLRDRHAVDDVLQTLRSRLFVGSTPKIASYRGLGSLCGWLRTVAVHAAQDYLRANKSNRQHLRQLADAQRVNAQGQARWMPASDEQAFQRDFAGACQTAWRSALHSLSEMERKLLHHHYVSGLSIDILGTLYGVHRATVARRIQRATARICGRVRATLSAHYQDWSGPDLDILARDACAELDLAGLLL